MHNKDMEDTTNTKCKNCGTVKTKTTFDVFTFEVCGKCPSAVEKDTGNKKPTNADHKETYAINFAKARAVRPTLTEERFKALAKPYAVEAAYVDYKVPEGTVNASHWAEGAIEARLDIEAEEDARKRRGY